MSDSDNADDDRCRQVTSDLLLAVNKAVELLSQVSYSQQNVCTLWSKKCHADKHILNYALFCVL
jgi:hypothetical protein